MSTADVHLNLLAKEIDKAERFRKNIVLYLAELYLDGKAVEVAGLCDERFDRSGALLGEVRIAARSPQANAEASDG